MRRSIAGLRSLPALAEPNCAAVAGRCRRGEIAVAGVALIADLAGALYWPEERLLVVSDLHLEKGSAFAARGMLLPPYDTASTLERLAALLARYAARIVIALGDNFHDGGGPARLAAPTAPRCSRCSAAATGFGSPATTIPSRARASAACSRARWRSARWCFATSRSRSRARARSPGHLHPSARIRHRGRILTRRCFASDGTRLVMPAFGAYTGGLNIRHAAFLKVFGALAFTAHLIGERRLYAFSAARCLAD